MENPAVEGTRTVPAANPEGNYGSHGKCRQLEPVAAAKHTESQHGLQTWAANVAVLRGQPVRFPETLDVNAEGHEHA